MQECTYTTQKTKKNKKWLDGFVAKTGTMVRLYDENKVIISTSAYKINDENELIELPLYLIYVDDLELFHQTPELKIDKSLKEELEVAENAEVPDISVKKVKIESSTCLSIESSYKDPKKYKLNTLVVKDNSISDVSDNNFKENEDVLELPKIQGRDFNDILDLFK